MCAKATMSDISDSSRLQAFVSFVDELEEHPFFTEGRKSKSFTVTVVADVSRPFRYNFDEFYLESFLLRCRQITNEGELFYFKDIRRSVLRVSSEDTEFREFYSRLSQVMCEPVKTGSVLRPNGKHLVKGYSASEILAAHLYRGRVHSEKHINPPLNSVFDGLDNEFMNPFLTHSVALLALRLGLMALDYRAQILRLLEMPKDFREGRSEAIGHFEKRSM